MRFLVAQSHVGVTPTGLTIVLVPSTWDDYTFKTTFRAFLWRAPDAPIWVDLGRIKILHETENSTRLPAEFTELGAAFCSLGQSPQYYECLHDVLPDDALLVLAALGDIALSLPERFSDHRGLHNSLLRFPDAEAALKVARQRFSGVPEAPEGKVEFTLSSRLHDFPTPHVLHLEFPPEGETFGRIAAVAGRNGTGKTQLLARLGAALCGLNLEEATLEPPARHHVVAISFNVQALLDTQEGRDRDA